MKIAVCADIHAHNYSQYSHITDKGLNSRLDWILRVLDEITNYAVKRELDAIVIAGDLFESRKSIDVAVLDSVYKVLSNTDIPLYIVKGNHDISYRGGNRYSISIFNKIANVITTAKVLTIANTNVGFLPWTEDTNVIHKALKLFQTNKVKYVIGHLALSGGYVGSHEYLVEGKVEPVLFRKFEWVALGHYHKHQKIRNNIYYVGSPIQHTWGETGDEKGFMVFSSSSKPRFIMLPDFPRFVRVRNKEDLSNVRDIDYVKVIGSRDDVDKLELPKTVKRIEVIERELEHKPRIEFDNTSRRSILKTYIEHFPQEFVDPEFLLEAGLDYLKD